MDPVEIATPKDFPLIDSLRSVRDWMVSEDELITNARFLHRLLLVENENKR